ncbi:glycoside hydrolase family 65 central catalytic [Fibrella aestuarina BUZ 2]|uniref:Glycoside hydrolase family 65 central catalytic n=1 Tax=Fibrella aestuarina BUZ 2 TaxID=1166018 RepID=I0KB58_9BACT|nr:glycoside hydrolase family 65 protein [Fibrella aestuarina]CCH01361.1 glycoside hydrolase family 65 central catalytic [Fibrella aestuarina BUZ 2]
MKQYITNDPWCVVEDGFHPEFNEITESLMSLGNGQMGGRGSFEEKFTGKTLLGNYVAGVYYPDKTRVGWWKNGYPEYFAKVLNATNWIGIDVEINDEVLDLNTCPVRDFRRVLNMQAGYLERSFVVTLKNGHEFRVRSTRFCSIVDDEAGAIRYSITPITADAKIVFTPYLDGAIRNKDANYDETFWDEVRKETAYGEAYIELCTRKTGFHVTTGMCVEVMQNGEKVDYQSQPIKHEKYVANRITLDCRQGQETVLIKYAVNLSSLNYGVDELLREAKAYIQRISAKGFETMLAEQQQAWADKWQLNDIRIDGDVAAQQGIRFNIFQLNQTYTGKDERLNIGPKGFTGEKYGGSTYWDTEAYCLPFYLATADQQVARNLLVYRHKHLQKAIENAQKLGFTDGAALYPMVTMNGEECHNEWEITFEEIHRNGAIAYAIYDYVRYTADEMYLAQYGLEVLIGISRFWMQRVNWSKAKQQYVMLGVTGPNEYENNVNNNWYTNYIAAWTLRYTAEAVATVKRLDAGAYEALATRIHFDETAELAKAADIVEKMHYPYDPERQVFLQQSDFLDKDLMPVSDIPAEQRPLNQHWSWDRILRSCFIKQADVLQGLYFFEDEFDTDTLRRNFDFYEPMTVHESSLSPCVHSIQASKLGMKAKAYEMYLRTARLDLDDYNNDTEDGCHITSMAGTWLAVVKGFGGLRVEKDQIVLAPYCPDGWEALAFKIRFRGTLLQITVTQQDATVANFSTQPITLSLHGEAVTIGADSAETIAHKAIAA